MELKLFSLIIFQLLQFATSQFGIRSYFFSIPENYPCGFNPSVHSGRCRKIKDCISVMKKERPIEICQINIFDPSSTLVCCSSEDLSDSRSHVPVEKGPLDYENCIEQYKPYRKIVDESAISFTVNGEQVEQGEFSHAAALGWIRWNDLSVDWQCGGSLITELFVVTAAHCTNIQGSAPYVVRVGDFDLESIDDDTKVQQKSIANIISHPRYDESTNLNDIALIQLAGRIV